MNYGLVTDYEQCLDHDQEKKRESEWSFFLALPHPVRPGEHSFVTTYPFVKFRDRAASHPSTLWESVFVKEIRFPTVLFKKYMTSYFNENFRLFLVFPEMIGNWSHQNNVVGSEWAEVCSSLWNNTTRRTKKGISLLQKMQGCSTLSSLISPWFVIRAVVHSRITMDYHCYRFKVFALTISFVNKARIYDENPYNRPAWFNVFSVVFEHSRARFESFLFGVKNNQHLFDAQSIDYLHWIVMPLSLSNRNQLEHVHVNVQIQ
jgi:hypothetical protein